MSRQRNPKPAAPPPTETVAATSDTDSELVQVVPEVDTLARPQLSQFATWVEFQEALAEWELAGGIERAKAALAAEEATS